MILDIVIVSELAFIGLEILDGYNLLANSVTNSLWHRLVTSEKPFEVEDMCSIPLKCIDTHL